MINKTFLYYSGPLNKQVGVVLNKVEKLRLIHGNPPFINTPCLQDDVRSIMLGNDQFCFIRLSYHLYMTRKCNNADKLSIAANGSQLEYVI